MSYKNGVSFFLFAHQDDEFGVFQAILSEQKIGREIFCAYMTDGAKETTHQKRRAAESLSILGKLGIPPSNIVFTGINLGIHDGALHTHLSIAENWIITWLEHHENAQHSVVYVPAWEGGHPDHDALHAIAAKIGHDSLGKIEIKQFSLYNAYGCYGPFFKVLHPIESNGPIHREIILWPNRFKFLIYCLSYPSQMKTWCGLFPFVLLHYFFKGYQETQEVQYRQIFKRPHSGLLYYEKRKFLNWLEMESSIRKWQMR